VGFDLNQSFAISVRIECRIRRDSVWYRDVIMQYFATKILAVSVIFSGAVAMAPTLAQDTNERAVEQYACRDILRESGSNRDVAIAFLHGFLLGKSGNTKFNLETMTKQTDAFLERCLDNPHDKAVDTMMKVKS
jgi:HdeA/HdeB family protein